MTKIEVTQADINAGVRDDPESCPLAIAMQRVVGQHVMIGGRTARIGPEDEDISPYTLLPEECGHFVAAFDEGLDVQPFTFEVNL